MGRLYGSRSVYLLLVPVQACYTPSRYVSQHFLSVSFSYLFIVVILHASILWVARLSDVPSKKLVNTYVNLRAPETFPRWRLGHLASLC